MEQHRQHGGRRKFLKALGEEPLVEAAAHAVNMGLNPYILLDRDIEDYPLVIAILTKAREMQGEEKVEEFKYLSKLIGLEVGQIVAKMFS